MISFTLLSITFSVCFDLRIINRILDKNIRKTYNICGITAALSGAALLGAPLIHDFAVISLSDLLTPWNLIEKRLTLAAKADFVICLYNPKSRRRKDHLDRAVDLIMKARPGDV